MYCNRCGNLLTSESLFCNRCGSKVQNQSAPAPATRRPAHLATPPPRPPRRSPVIPSSPDQDEEYEDDYPERYESGRYEEDYREGFDDQEQVIFSITPAFYEVAPSYVWAAVFSLIITAAVALAHVDFQYAVIVAAVFFIPPILRHIRLKRTVYTLTNVKVEIQTGIFAKSTRNIPLRHIQDVTVTETLKERMIGIGDVLIDSAAVEGKIKMNNIKSPRKYADMILDQLQNWR